MIGSARQHLIATAAGLELRRMRLAAGLTQQQVAVYCDSWRPIVARTERGRHMPTLEVCAVMAAVCDGSLLDVLGAVDRAIGAERQPRRKRICARASRQEAA